MKRATCLLSAVVALLVTDASAQEWQKDHEHCTRITASVEAGLLNHLNQKQISALADGLLGVVYFNTGTPAETSCFWALNALNELFKRRNATTK